MCVCLFVCVCVCVYEVSIYGSCYFTDCSELVYLIIVNVIRVDDIYNNYIHCEGHALCMNIACVLSILINRIFIQYIITTCLSFKVSRQVQPW